jgi:adenine-specific DNA-methyltransferase
MNKYENLSKEELLKLIEKQEAELKSKKYGLVWDAEREPEQVVLDCESNLPVLKRVKGKEIRTNDEDDNILIEGDNYHALTVLNYTHKEKIDVIYIDPPYNTGNKDFVYNDRYVDREDGYRHSKWLNFMEKRLNLAKNLLKETGVIFISIDDNEVAQLKMLCDKVFGEINFENIFNIKVRHENRILRQDIRYQQTLEYLVCYSKQSKIYTPARIENLKDIENDYRYEIKISAKKPDKIVNIKGYDIEIYQKEDYKLIQVNNGLGSLKQYSIRGSLITQKGSASEFYEKNLKQRKGEDGLGALYRVMGMGEKGDGLGYRFITQPSSNKIKNGIYYQGRPIKIKTNNNLPYPNYFDFVGEFNNVGYEGETDFKNGKKPLVFIEKILQIAGFSRNGTILDFFAGSGSVGHAILGLNKKDNGNRKFILCTNNDLNGYEKEFREKNTSEKEMQKYGICQRVTYPRLEKVIKGYQNSKAEDVEGLGGNLQYFKTDLVKKTTAVQTKLDITFKCTEMLCVKENIFNLEKEVEDWKIFSSNKKDKFLCIYYNFIEKSFDDFLTELKKIKAEKAVYIFSLSDELDEEIIAGVENARLESIPQKILKVYEEWVKKNVPMRSDLILLEFQRAKERIFDQEDKEEGARLLRIVLEKTIVKISQQNGVEFLKENAKGEKTSILNDKLKGKSIFSKVQWEENKTFLAIGNYAAHGEYDQYELEQVKNFYKHVQALLSKFNLE